MGFVKPKFLYAAKLKAQLITNNYSIKKQPGLNIQTQLAGKEFAGEITEAQSSIPSVSMKLQRVTVAAKV